MRKLNCPPRRWSVCSGLLLLSVVLRAAAQQPSDTVAHRAATHSIPVATAMAAAKAGPVRIDGRIDEEAWTKAVPITDFTQIDPDEGKPGTQLTEVRFLYDDEALYVSARMFDTSGRSGITTRLVRRDAEMESDWFQVVIDGYHDHSRQEAQIWGLQVRRFITAQTGTGPVVLLEEDGRRRTCHPIAVERSC